MTLEPSGLDWADVGAWPTAVKCLCHAACLLLALAIGYGILIADSRAEQARLQAEEDRLGDELERKRLLAEPLSSVRGQRREGVETLAALIHRLPSEAEVPRLIDSIARAAEDSGLATERIELAGERTASSTASTDGYLELNIAIVVSGTYHGIGAFAAAIAGLQQLAILHDFQLRPADAANAATLTLTATAKTYRLDADPAGAAP